MRTPFAFNSNDAHTAITANRYRAIAGIFGNRTSGVYFDTMMLGTTDKYWNIWDIPVCVLVSEFTRASPTRDLENLNDLRIESRQEYDHQGPPENGDWLPSPVLVNSSSPPP
jgi:hypothetical protein